MAGGAMRARREALDGLRGVAALAVVVYHSVLGLAPTAHFEDLLVQPVQLVQSGYALLTRIILIVFNGKLAVAYFFVLSGAVLMKSLNDERSAAPATAVKFAARRLIRLYPTLIGCLLVFYIALNGLHELAPAVFPQQIANSALIENSLLTKISIHGATWTLQVEVVMIPVMLLAALLWRAGGLLGLSPLIAFAAVAFFVGLPSCPEPISRNLLAFLLGAAAISEHVGRIVGRFPRFTWAILVAAAVVLPHFFPATNWTAQLATLVLCAISVACLYHERGGDWLTTRPLLALGRISYSLYLFNVVVMNVLIAIIVYATAGSSSQHYLEFGVLLAALTLLASIPIAILSERLIEQPSIQLGRRITAASIDGWGRRLIGSMRRRRAQQPAQ